MTAPYGISVHRNGRALHRLAAVRRNGHRLEGRWACVGNSPWAWRAHVIEVDDPETVKPWCERCRINEPAQQGPVVYVCRLADGTVKVGTTTAIHMRMESLGHPELLATAPGGREVEDVVLAQVRERFAPIRGREWFSPNSEALALAALEAVAA